MEEVEDGKRKGDDKKPSLTEGREGEQKVEE
jgi:hypothetical protein